MFFYQNSIVPGLIKSGIVTFYFYIFKCKTNKKISDNRYKSSVTDSGESYIWFQLSIAEDRFTCGTFLSNLDESFIIK